MKYIPYSHSKLSTYYQCPMKFKLNYIDKIKVPFNSNVALLKGSHIHKILENNFNYDTPFELNNIYGLEDYNKTIDIVKKFQVSELGLKIAKLINIGVKEQNFAFDENFLQSKYYDKNTFFRGSADLYYIKNDICYIFDYKSGKDKSTDADFGVDQAMVYALNIFSKHPNVQIVKAFFVFIEYEVEKKIEFFRENIEYYKKTLLDGVSKCEEDIFFKKNTGPLCDYCQFKEHGHCGGQENHEEFFNQKFCLDLFL